MKMNSSMEDLASQSIKKRNNNRSVETKSLLGEGKLLIELKISKDGGEEDTENPNIEGLLHKDQMSQNSVCDLCNKSFKSGKALGGHMRIHSQKGKQKEKIFNNKVKARQSVMFKKQNPRAADNCAGGSTDERPSCPVCRKKFPSRKSVFGHMRKHPDRNWRGSRPPSIEKMSSDSCLSYEENPKNSDQDELLVYGEKKRGVDLTIHLRGWNSTARRGRKRLILEMDDFQLKELEAADGLMMLLGRDFESGDLVGGQKGGGEFEDVKSKLDVREPSIIGREGHDVSLNDDIKNSGSKMLIKNKKKRKKVKLSDLELPPNDIGSSQEIDLNKLPCEAEIEGFAVN